MSWPVQYREGSARHHHHLDLVPERGVWVFQVDEPTVVLGSTQPDDVLDRTRVDASGVAVARRRSGGGVVGLVPGGSVWVDVVVPAGDPFWDDDVGRSFLWLGEVWRASLATLGVVGQVMSEPKRDRVWSDLVCFAGQSTGELTVGDSKVVGLSQRRSREMARFQSLVLLDPSLDLVIDHLDLPAASRRRLRRDAAAMTSAVPAHGADVVAALLAHLP